MESYCPERHKISSKVFTKTLIINFKKGCFTYYCPQCNIEYNSYFKKRNLKKEPLEKEEW